MERNCETAGINPLKIKVKYFSDVDKIRVREQGDWVDLRAAKNVTLMKGEIALIPLGVGMKLPEGYEAHLAPRSSMFRNFGIIQTNGVGVIDNSYSGDNDEWMLPVIAMRDTEISKHVRICQFRIMKKQPEVEFETVEHLDDTDRGGFGSSGVN